MQEAGKLEDKLNRASNEEEKEAIFRGLEITQTKINLVYSRRVRQKNLMWWLFTIN